LGDAKNQENATRFGVDAGGCRGGFQWNENQIFNNLIYGNDAVWIIEPEPGIRLPAMRIGKQGAPGPITLVPGRDHAMAPGPGNREAVEEERSLK
jgi:hypothetical protein